jgi:hypothetical protein
MAVTVSGDNTVSISITEANAIAVDVGQVQQSGVTAYGGIGPTIVVSGTHTAFIGTIGINPFVAGPNITVTQSAGNITISGRDPQTPTTIVSVTGVSGKTLFDDVSTVIGRLTPTNAPTSVPLVSGPSGSIRTASSYVSSVSGRTGAVSLAVADITTSPGVVTLTNAVVSSSLTVGKVAFTANSDNSVSIDHIVDNAGIARLADNLIELNASVYLNNEIAFSDDGVRDASRVALGAAAASHSHGNIASGGSVGTAAGRILVTLANGVVTAATSISTTQITNFASAAGAVKSVNGQVGTVTIGQADIGSIFGNDNLGGDLVQLSTELEYVEDKFPNSAVPAGRVLVSSNEGSGGAFRIKASTGFVHSIGGCTGTVTINAGTDIKITKNTSNSSITVAYSGSGGGGSGGNAIWPALILGG